MVDTISDQLNARYSKVFEEYGATPKGAHWGESSEDHKLRLEKMLAVTNRGNPDNKQVSILDVGCSYGGLLDLILYKDADIDYHGIDIGQPMIESAQERHPNANWHCGNILDSNMGDSYDYVVCNGVLTLKCEASIRDMNHYLRRVVRKMFELCRIGVAFNVLTTHLDVMRPELHYCNPSEILAWCMSELTTRVCIDHAYPLVDYTVYLYKEQADGIRLGSHRKL